MTDFTTQDVAAIAATAPLAMDANTVVPMAKTHVPNTQLADAVGAPSQLESQAGHPPSDVMKSKQEERRDLFALVDVVRCLVEMRCARVVNQKHGTAYKGTFDMRLDSPDEVTLKTLNAFLSKGVVTFFPDNVNDHPALKKYCKQDGGINLSALITRKNRPANINDAEWNSLMEMWTAVSVVLHTKGIEPIYGVFTEALRSFGYGGPKINRKLGGSANSGQGDPAQMQNVLKKLISLLAELGE